MKVAKITPDGLDMSSFLDVVLQRSVLGRLNITKYDNLNQPLTLPKMTKNAVDAFGWVDENGVSPEADIAVESFTMTPKNFTGGVPMSKYSLQTVPDHDPSFVDVSHLLAFPELSATREMSRFETYDSDTECILPGGRTFEDTEITLALIPDDPALQMLDDALETKDPLRFRMFYQLNIEDNSPGVEGYYRIFDGHVVGETFTGDIEAPAQKTYQISIEKMYDSGIARKGNPLLTGDYGVGAGTTDYPGVIDWVKLSGNRFVTFPGSSAQNPFGVDTGAIAVQGNDNQGWQMLVNSSGKPLIRIRNMTQNKPQNWIRVFSTEEKPTAADVEAVSLKGDTMTGALYSPEIRGTTFRFCPIPGEANEAGLPRFIQTTNRAGEAVTIATMRHASNKGYTSPQGETGTCDCWD